MNIAGKTLKRRIRACFDLLLPRTCIVCGRRLQVDERLLCLPCRIDLPLTYYWERPHNPMADRFNEAIQRDLDTAWERGQAHEPYAYACALFFYDSHGKYRYITQSLKYHGDLECGRHFGRMIGAMIAASEHYQDISLVIPVPLHWRRKWERGYNQAEVIARETASRLGLKMRADILERRRYTKTQTRLDVSGKTANVRGAFQINEKIQDEIMQICGNHILIIDDVFTTGATLHACFRSLREVLPQGVRISVATLGFVGR